MNFRNNSQKNFRNNSQMNMGNNSQKKSSSQRSKKRNSYEYVEVEDEDDFEVEDEEEEDDDEDDNEDDEDEEEDEDNYIKKAENGNVEAKYRLSQMRSKNQNDRKYWFGKAIEAGHEGAERKMASIRERQNAAQMSLRTTWQKNEKFLFTENTILDFVEVVGIRRDNLLYKEEIMVRGLDKRIFTDDLLRKLPCPEYRLYMQNGVVQTNIDYAYIMSKTTDTISAVIFAELGECEEYPKYWTVRLICGTAGTKDARTLLGLYLYALKKIKQPIGILEVAQSYNNLAAYCLYAKFGFEEAYKYKQFIGCKKFTHLPLLNGLSNITEEDIIDITSARLDYENDLCLKKSDKAAQNAYIKNVLLPKWSEAGYNISKFYR